LLIEISTRFNIGTKIEIITKAATLANMDREDQDCLCEILGEKVFLLYKGYRDAIVHAIVINAAIGVGIGVNRRAKINEVLLSANALDALYDHLLHLEKVLQQAASVMIFAIKISGRAPDDQERLSYEAGKVQNSAQFRRIHAGRKKLPLIPEFPSAQQFHEADVEWRQARQAERMATFLILERRRRLLRTRSRPRPS
jgi:hypothetical protein